MSREGTTMFSKKIVFVTTAVAPIACSAMAFAGDYPAHAKAADEAVKELLKNPKFAGGVGTPEFTLFSGWNGGFSKDELEQAPVNDPDQWACTESADRAPPLLTQILTNEGPNSTYITRELGTFHTCGLAMACNYTHFVENSVEFGMPTAKMAEDITSDWAHEIIDNNIRLGTYGPDDSSSTHGEILHDAYCTDATWKNYWRRVLKSLHFAQDQQSEDHQIGNRNCGPMDDIPPLASTGRYFNFIAYNKCLKWLDERWNDMTSPLLCKKQLTCDGSVYAPDAKLCQGPSDRTWTIYRACFDLGIRAACMGLERLIYHHCNFDERKSFICAKPEEFENCHDVAKEGYCEGEVCPDCGKEDCPGQGGENFVLKAKNVSVPKLEKAAQDWADVCTKEPTPCTPSECQSWCWKRLTTPLPALNPVRGRCLTQDDGSSKCSCDITGVSRLNPKFNGTFSDGQHEYTLSVSGNTLTGTGKFTPPNEPTHGGTTQFNDCKGNGNTAKCPKATGEYHDPDKKIPVDMDCTLTLVDEDTLTTSCTITKAVPEWNIPEDKRYKSAVTKDAVFTDTDKRVGSR